MAHWFLSESPHKSCSGENTPHLTQKNLCDDDLQNIYFTSFRCTMYVGVQNTIHTIVFTYMVCRTAPTFLTKNTWRHFFLPFFRYVVLRKSIKKERKKIHFFKKLTSFFLLSLSDRCLCRIWLPITQVRQPKQCIVVKYKELSS